MEPEKQPNLLKYTELEKILRDLLKAVKVVALYPESNPLPQSLRRTVSERITAYLKQWGMVTLHIDAQRITCDQEVILESKKEEDPMVTLLYEAGISKLQLLDHLSEMEVLQFLDVTKAYLNQKDGDADLVSLLWEANIPGIAFQTVEDIALAEYDSELVSREFGNFSGDTSRKVSAGEMQMVGDDVLPFNAIFSDGDDLSDSDRIEQAQVSLSDEILTDSSTGIAAQVAGALGAVFELSNSEESERLKVAPAVEAMGLNDIADNVSHVPSTKLILNDELRLSEEEEERARKMVADDALLDEYASVSELVKELMHQEFEYDGFSETVTIAEKVTRELIQGGHIGYAAEIVQYFQVLESKISAEKPQWAGRLKQAKVSAGSREYLAYLVLSLNERPELNVNELRRYLGALGWEVLSSLTEILSQLQSPEHRECVSSYIAQHGQQHLPLLAKGVFDNQPDTAIAAVTALIRISNDTAMGYLKRAAEHRKAEVRAHLASELPNCKHDDAIPLLGKLVVDETAEVSRAAVACLTKQRGEAAFYALADAIDSERFSKLDRSDQHQVLNAYSQLGGASAISYLHQLIKQVSLFSGPVSLFFRHAAFEALSYNRSDQAEKLLLRLQRSWRPRLRRMAKETLKLRRERLLGDDHD